MGIDWEVANNCKHTDVYENYGEPLGCLCGGYEYHCKDCGVYFSECSCGEATGMSGWPIKRWKKQRSS